jgi:ankyrin repeat protein
MIINDSESLDADPALVNLLVPFPDQKRKTDGRTWLPLHFALALGKEVKEKDVRLLYSYDPIAMQKPHLSGSGNSDKAGYSPGHFLCMQIEPNMSLMRYLSTHNNKAYTIRVCCGESYKGSRNALQLAAQFSESVDLIRDLMQIDQSMTNKVESYSNQRSVTALGFLCGRSHSTSFNEIYELLIAANSSVEVVIDDLWFLLRFHGKSSCSDGQIQVVLAQVESLLKANSSFKSCKDDVRLLKIMDWACSSVEGKLGVAILSLLLTEYSDGVGAGLRLRNIYGSLPVHTAARYSTLDVADSLLKE